MADPVHKTFEMVTVAFGSLLEKFTDDVDISLDSYEAIFTEVLDMKRRAAKMVSKLQNFEQKQCRLDIIQEVLAMFIDDPDLLKMVITLKPKPS